VQRLAQGEPQSRRVNGFSTEILPPPVFVVIVRVGQAEFNCFATMSRSMSTVHFETDSVRIPLWVTDLRSFRRWAESEEFPGKAAVCYLAGELWVEMSKEQLYSHNQVKTEFARVLAGLAKQHRSGRYFGDGLFLTNVEADLSTKPDGTFVSREAFAANRVRLVEGVQEGFVEIEGTPDMVLEVVSGSSVSKDREWLRDLYRKAGIAEYWLVDCRGDRLDFDILRHTAGGYAPANKSAGWVESAVFGHAFLLTRQSDELGHPEYTLEARATRG
jgi:Uma2 family endonuclease